MRLQRSVLAFSGTVLLLSLAIAMHAVGQNGSVVLQTAMPVEAVTLQAQNFDEVVPGGKEVDAIYGDVTLRNGFLSAVIAQPLANRHANMTVKDVAGAVIDLCARNKSGGDQLAAFYPGRKAFPYRTIMIRNAAGEDLPSKEQAASESSAVVIKADGADERPEVTVTYQVNKQQPFLSVTSNFVNQTSKTLTINLEDDLRIDSQKEEAVRSPNGTEDRFWIYDSYWGQAYGLDADGYKLQLTTDINAKVTTIKYENAAGQSSVMLSPGESFQLKRRLYPGATIFDVHAIAGKAGAAMPVEISLAESRQIALDNLTLELSQGETSLGRTRISSGGVLNTSLPPGSYRAQFSFCGNPVGPGDLNFQVGSGKNQIVLTRHIPRGRLLGAITERNSGGVPCKVELTPLDEGAKLNFGPETGEFVVRNLIYTPNGKFDQTVPPGKYAVTISHGPEFDIIRKEIELKDGAELLLNGVLTRSVDTMGWVSSDFHSHSTPSGDNTSSQLGRVLNLVCEHVEFAPCTEHNRVSTYAPHIKQLAVEPFISSVPGIELTSTPLPLNHQNAFPMKYTPRTQDGGGPISGPDLESQIERLALWDNRSEKLVQVNHPDLGWMFYDKNGDGKPDSGFERAFPFMDVVEIHPIESALQLGPTFMRDKTLFHNTVFNWLQLLNQGFRIYGVVNTDAHYNFHGSGFLRNWIQSSTDEPSKIDFMEMVHAAEQGRMVMSNGPYLEVTASEAGKMDEVVSGQDLKAASGKVTLKVRVQCPNWIDVNRLFVLINGRPHPIHDYSREKHPDAFRSGVVKFDRSLDLDLKGDVHVIVVTGQLDGSLRSVYGTQYGKSAPTAISNPIFVDVDGNGFQANKDTLGASLPVKHPNSK